MLRHVHHSSASSRSFVPDLTRPTRVQVSAHSSSSSSSSSSSHTTTVSSRSHSPATSRDFGLLPPSIFLLPGGNGGTIGGGASSAHKFHPDSSRDGQLDLRQIESHLTITIHALDQARRTFLLQFSCLMALASGFLAHWIYQAWIAADGGSGAKHREGSNSHSLLLFGCCMICILVYIASGTLTDRVYGADQYIQSINRWLDLFGVRWQPRAPAGERFLLEDLPPLQAPPSTAVFTRTASRDITKRGGSWVPSPGRASDEAVRNSSSSAAAAADPFDQPLPSSLQFSSPPILPRSTAVSSSSIPARTPPIPKAEETGVGVDAAAAAASVPETTARALTQLKQDQAVIGEDRKSDTDSAVTARSESVAVASESSHSAATASSSPPPTTVSPTCDGDNDGKDTPMTVQAELERLPEAEFAVKAVAAVKNSE